MWPGWRWLASIFVLLSDTPMRLFGVLALGGSLVAPTAAVQERRGAPAPVAFWIVNASANSVLGFAGISDGNFPPSRILAGGQTGLDAPSAVATDARGALSVANAGNNSVTVYPPDADGNSAPRQPGRRAGRLGRANVAWALSSRRISGAPLSRTRR